MNEENEVAVPETAEVVTPEVTEEELEVEDMEEGIEELREKLAKAEELANNQKIRAEKAEKRNKAPVESLEREARDKDLVAIMKAGVPEEDLDEVYEYARYRKTTVANILKDPIMKNTLEQRSEERNSAVAANVSVSRRGSTKVPDDILISNASKGKLPENERDIDRLMKAKLKELK